MSLKSYFLIVFGIFSFFSCSEQKEKMDNLATIEGEITHIPAQIKNVRLARIDAKGPTVVDSAIFEADGKFSLALPADSERLYVLEVGGQRLPLFLEAGPHSLKGDFNQLYQSASFSNSRLTTLLKRVESTRVDFEQNAQTLEMNFKMAMGSGNQKGADSAMEGFFSLQKSTKQYVKHLIDSIGPNPVSHLATSMLSVDEDFGYLDSLANRFEKEKPGAAYTEKMKSYLEVPRKLAIGKKAPDFSQPDPTGKPVSLSQFKGQWVLLDFWASWCKPCRAENPTLKKAFQNYKDKGFTILSVSIDTNKDAWLKAIVTDKMFWAHASDLTEDNAAARPYFVRSIPSSFLINPEGRIAAKNLRGPALEQKLSEVFRGK
jgi:peroxiredoxin